MNIHISNLGPGVTDQQLKDLFTPYGEVLSAEVAMDAFTGKHRGFGYVEMAEATAGQQAIEALNNTQFQEQAISVTVAGARQVHKGSYKVGNGAVTAYRFHKN